MTINTACGHLIDAFYEKKDYIEREYYIKRTMCWWKYDTMFNSMVELVEKQCSSKETIDMTTSWKSCVEELEVGAKQSNEDVGEQEENVNLLIKTVKNRIEALNIIRNNKKPQYEEVAKNIEKQSHNKEQDMKDDKNHLMKNYKMTLMNKRTLQLMRRKMQCTVNCNQMRRWNY